MLVWQEGLLENTAKYEHVVNQSRLMDCLEESHSTNQVLYKF